jgi:transcriptional regulator with XRE-family HTH domain
MGRPAKPPATRRGRLLFAIIEAKGLTLGEAADRAGVDRAALERALHAPDVSSMALGTVERLVHGLDFPLALFSPRLATAASRRSRRRTA